MESSQPSQEPQSSPPAVSPQNGFQQPYSPYPQYSYTGAAVLQKPFPHGIHAIITMVTCGLWLPVWLLLAWADGRSRKRMRLMVFQQQVQPPPGYHGHHHS